MIYIMVRGENFMACKDMINNYDYDYTLDLLFDKMYDYAFITDSLGKIVHVNSSMLEVFQCSRNKLIGTNIFNYINYSNIDEIIADLDEAKENYIEKKSIKLKFNSCKYIITDVNIFLGTWNEDQHIFFIFDSKFSPRCEKITTKILQGNNYGYEDFIENCISKVKYNSIIDSQDNVCHGVGIANDITDIKLMKRQLRENEARLRFAIEDFKIGYWDWDIVSGNMLIDKKWMEIIGYNIENTNTINYNTWKQLIHEEDLKGSSEAMRAYLKGELENYECELRMKAKDENWMWIVIRGDIVERNENNIPLRMVGIYIDITERKEIKFREERLMKREEENKIRNEFLANISHELRTPINVIFSAIQMENTYINKMDINELLKYNKIIRQNCLRLIRITNNIIDMTRIDSGFLKPVFKVENIVSLVECITLSVVSYAENKGINVIFDTEDEEIYVRCDFNLIERIILNILSNSVKYGKENGFIKINIYKISENKVRIVIKDNGIGIPNQFLGKIFGRFQRADNGMSSNNEGSGIGLSLVKALIEIQKGNIDLKSVVGEGTEFILEFPISEENIEENSGEEKTQSKINNMIEKVNIEFSHIYI